MCDQLIAETSACDQLIAETSAWQHTSLTPDNHPCPWQGYKPRVSAGEWLQTYVLDHAATGTSTSSCYKL